MRRHMQGGDILLVAFLAFSVLNTWVALLVACWFFSRPRAKSKGVALLDSETMEAVSNLRLAKLQDELLGLSMKHFN
jgi:hypothetical protein